MALKVMIFSPHPDDAEYYAGGTIAKMVQEGTKAYIVIVTDGRVGSFEYDSQSLAQIRKSAGAALSPLLVGIIADRSSLKSAFLIICLSTWALCAFLFIFTAYLAPRDMKILRQQMRIRADQSRAALDNEQQR